MTSLSKSLSKLFSRDLIRLENEISLYDNSEALWQIDGQIKNPGGNLCLHLCGNLQYYIGAVLGDSGYTRDRENEFNAKGISREHLISEIKATQKAVGETLQQLTQESLTSIYPERVFDEPMTTEYFLLHLACHLAYHLGQINYHRRFLSAR